MKNVDATHDLGWLRSGEVARPAPPKGALPELRQGCVGGVCQSAPCIRGPGGFRGGMGFCSIPMAHMGKLSMFYARLEQATTHSNGCCTRPSARVCCMSQLARSVLNSDSAPRRSSQWRVPLVENSTSARARKPDATPRQPIAPVSVSKARGAGGNLEPTGA